MASDHTSTSYGTAEPRTVGAHEKLKTLIEFNFDKYKIAIQTEKEPEIYQMWLEHASFKDIDGLKNDETPIYIGVGQEGQWYETIIAYCSDPIENCGFNPGFLIIPETETLFIGAGKVVRTYDLKNHKRKIEKNPRNSVKM